MDSFKLPQLTMIAEFRFDRAAKAARFAPTIAVVDLLDYLPIGRCFRAQAVVFR